MALHSKLFEALEDGSLLGLSAEDLKIIAPKGYTPGRHAIALRTISYHESISMPHLRPQWFKLIDGAENSRALVPFRSIAGSHSHLGNSTQRGTPAPRELQNNRRVRQINFLLI